MEPLALGLDSDADAAAVRSREHARVPAGRSPEVGGLVPGDELATSPPRAEAGATPRAPDGIDWTIPPYTRGGLVRLVLEGENADAIPRAEMDRRLGERQRQLMAAARSVWDLDVTDYRRAARAVFGESPAQLAPPAATS